MLHYVASMVKKFNLDSRKTLLYFTESEPADMCNCSNSGGVLLVISVVQTLMTVK